MDTRGAQAEAYRMMGFIDFKSSKAKKCQKQHVQEALQKNKPALQEKLLPSVSADVKDCKGKKTKRTRSGRLKGRLSSWQMGRGIVRRSRELSRLTRSCGISSGARFSSKAVNVNSAAA